MHLTDGMRNWWLKIGRPKPLIVLSLITLLPNLWMIAINAQSLLFTANAITYGFLVGRSTITPTLHWVPFLQPIGKLIAFLLGSADALLGMAIFALVMKHSEMRQAVLLRRIFMATYLFVGVYPVLSLFLPLPGFYLVTDLSGGPPAVAVSTYPSALSSLSGSASPYNIRFGQMTFATSVIPTIHFLNPVQLGPDPKGVLDSLMALSLLQYAISSSLKTRGLAAGILRPPQFILSKTAKAFAAAVGDRTLLTSAGPKQAHTCESAHSSELLDIPAPTA